MPRKKSGMPFVVFPSPMKGKDGRNMVYVKPQGGANMKLSIDQIDDYCAKYGSTRPGQLRLVLGEFIHWASEWVAKGYRVDTPIGSFAPKLKLKRAITDADDVTDNDVEFDGIDLNPGKRWDEEIKFWMRDGFRKVERFSSTEVLDDKESLEQVLRDLLKKHGYVTVEMFRIRAFITSYSARKLLNDWTEGPHPKLLKTRQGQTFIYTET